MVFIWMILEKGPLFAGMTTYVVPVLALLWGTVDSRDDQPPADARDCRRAGDGCAVQTGSRSATAPNNAIADEAGFEPTDCRRADAGAGGPCFDGFARVASGVSRCREPSGTRRMGERENGRRGD